MSRDTSKSTHRQKPTESLSIRPEVGLQIPLRHHLEGTTARASSPVSTVRSLSGWEAFVVQKQYARTVLSPLRLDPRLNVQARGCDSTSPRGCISLSCQGDTRGHESYSPSTCWS